MITRPNGLPYYFLGNDINADKKLDDMFVRYERRLSE